MNTHPAQLVVQDDYYRNRLTVFFRLLLAIPHFIWFILWSLLAVVVAILNWVATLILGKPPRPIHDFLCSFIRYCVHLSAYLGLVADEYPGFRGEAGSYPIDVELPEDPQAQARWKTLLRPILAIPALVIGGMLGGSISASVGIVFRPRNSSARFSGANPAGGFLWFTSAFLGWFASLVTGRMPKGLRDAGAYGIGYSAHVKAYAFFLTDVYPNSDPTAMLAAVEPPPLHPVHVVGDAHDLRRSRVMVFFRLPLTIPLYLWLALWGYLMVVVVVINWLATLIMGTPPRWCYRFTARYVRYQFHVLAFLTIAANPYPGFTGAPGTYPLDLELPEDPPRQSRLKTLFRLFLAIPAFFVALALTIALYTAAFFTWFAALLRGSAPWGLRNLMAYALRYLAQTYAYVYLITDAYPNASPLEGAAPQVEAAPVEIAPAEAVAIEPAPVADAPVEAAPVEDAPVEPAPPEDAQAPEDTVT